MSQNSETQVTSNQHEPVSLEIPANDKSTANGTTTANEQVNNEQLPTNNQVIYNPASPTTPIIIQPMPSRFSLSISQQPSDYIAWSIVNSLFCCWCLGIGALIFSVITFDRVKRKNYASAFDSSRVSFYLNLSSTVIGSFLFTILIISYSTS
jgi:hypothetical protein